MYDVDRGKEWGKDTPQTRVYGSGGVLPFLGGEIALYY